MAVQTNSPQITALRIAVEKCFGHRIESRYDYTQLGGDIERITHEHIADNTLRRLCYAGFEDWADFCNYLAKKGGRESSLLEEKGHSIRTEDLRSGDRLHIAWLPDRECIIEFQGGRTFRAIDCRNSTLQNGDSFECGVLIRDFPLAVDNLIHDGKLYPRYVMGNEHGLTLLEKI